MSGAIVINKPLDVDLVRYWESQHKPAKLEAALNYLNSADEPFIFTSHYGTQYSFNKPDRTDRVHNLVITDFVTKYKDDSWNTNINFTFVSICRLSFLRKKLNLMSLPLE